MTLCFFIIYKPNGLNGGTGFPSPLQNFPDVRCPNCLFLPLFINNSKENGIKCTVFVMQQKTRQPVCTLTRFCYRWTIFLNLWFQFNLKNDTPTINPTRKEVHSLVQKSWGIFNSCVFLTIRLILTVSCGGVVHREKMHFCWGRNGRRL